MKKKNVVYCILLTFLSLNVNAQENDKPLSRNRIGVYTSVFTGSDLSYLKTVDGGGTPDIQGSVKIGLNYIHGINKWLDFETGLELSSYEPGMIGDRGLPTLNIFSIPLTVKANFLKYFFVNGGALVDLDVSRKKGFAIDKQNGIGAVLGLGFEYDFKNGISIYANPYVKAYSLLYLTLESIHQRVLEAGVRIGATYRF
ncbi:MAG: hypothetical protein LBE91_21330 [Tannerella sp.]|jgi:hypothetical protein|nr:hypothetical protein [Tannerella sp.]